MTGASAPTGRRILVVEDDYLIACEVARVLRGAGSEVLGPCKNEAAAWSLLEVEVPTHAVLDLNLGSDGPQFEVAHLLKARSVPFVFLTGYNTDVIPPDMTDVVCLQKPVMSRDLVEAITRL